MIDNTTKRFDCRPRRLGRLWPNDHRHRPARLILLSASLVAIGAGLALGAHIAWFYHRLSVQGGALITQEKALVERAAVHSEVSCAAPWPTAEGPQGLLEAPSIGLRAPVLAGTDDAQLDVAVGHLSSSVWPGERGTTLLAAHDVSYFSRINALSNGSTIDFVTPCRTFVYVVGSQQVVAAGSAVYSDASGSRLMLETCYPLNALYLTSQRYLVTADLVAAVRSGRDVASAASAAPPPRVPAAPALAAQGLGLSTNDVQLGTLQLQRTPDSSWQQSLQPINSEEAVLATYNAAVRSAEQAEDPWWQPLTSQVSFSASLPLRGAEITGYTEALTPTLEVKGNTLVGAVVDAGIQISGGSSPGRYHLHVTMVDYLGTLIITGWQLTPGS